MPSTTTNSIRFTRNSSMYPARALLASLAILAAACGGSEADGPAIVVEGSAGSSGSGSSLGGLRLSAATVQAGGTITATVYVSAPSDRSVPVFLNLPRTVVSGPRYAMVPAGRSSATVTLYANPYLGADTAVVIAGNTQSPNPYALFNASLTVTAGPLAGAAAPQVAALTFSPATVTSGSSATGTITLTAPAPATGAPVVVNNPNDTFNQVARVPMIVVVPAGATSVDFAVPTSLPAGATSTALPIVGSAFGGVFRGSYLTINR